MHLLAYKCCPQTKKGRGLKYFRVAETVLLESKKTDRGILIIPCVVRLVQDDSADKI